MFTREEANILKPSGFAAHVQKLREHGMTHVKAYEETEKIHERVDDKHERAYTDFVSYMRQFTKNNAKRKVAGCVGA
ncbi:hypothetical protein [Spirosoma foliorum]|uniref:Uncharacterized protein n=1 Tax=Spirosoma foliorum TaxID=2710596 RepID=A0A7G5H2J6_9BACT|nr:hypothetical protein [Spirosoma foliorum]QMW05338.1 hypothetical protein H3H32_10835 [Spirosoma foliorum]